MRKPSGLTLLAAALGATFVGIAALILPAVVNNHDSDVVSVENEKDLRLCHEASGGVNIEVCTRAIQSNRHTGRSLAWALNKRGALYYAAGEFERALADFSASILINAQDASAFRNRCAVYIQKREYDRAVADCNEAIRFEPEMEDAYYNRGLAYYHLTRYREAVIDFDASLKLNPKREDALQMRGVANSAVARVAPKAAAQSCESGGTIRFAAETERGFPFPPNNPEGIITKLKGEHCGFTAIWMSRALVQSNYNCKFGQVFEVTGRETKSVPSGGPFSGKMLVASSINCPR